MRKTHKMILVWLLTIPIFFIYNLECITNVPTMDLSGYKIINIKNKKRITCKKDLDTIIQTFGHVELNELNLAKFISTLDLEYPEFVYKQALLESGYLKSRNCKLNNNLFGMGVAKRRETYSYFTNTSRYGRFDSWLHSVADYKLRQLNDPFNKDEGFEQYLKRTNYASDKLYFKKLVNVKIDKNIKIILKN